MKMTFIMKQFIWIHWLKLFIDIAAFFKSLFQSVKSLYV